MTFRSSSGEVPAPPRAITPDMERDAARQGRFLRLFGGIWAGVGWALAGLFLVLSVVTTPGFWMGGLLGAVFGCAGIVLFSLGFRQQRSAREVFRSGIEAQAEVVEVFLDRRLRVNRRHPWRVVYELRAQDGAAARGSALFWSPHPPNARPGQRVIALHDRADPSRSVLWSRLEHAAELGEGATARGMLP